MATFTQWHKKIDEVKKAVIVCGPAKDLVTYVVDEEIKKRRRLGYQIVFLEGSTKKFVDLLFQSSGRKKLFVYYDFDRIKKRDIFLEFLRSSEDHLILVSNANKMDTKEKILSGMIKLGKYVRCCPVEDMEELVGKLIDNITLSGVRALITVTNGNLQVILIEAKKLGFLNCPITDRVVYDFCSHSGYDDIFDLLLAGQKDMVLKNLSGSIDFGMLVGQISYRIKQFAMMLPTKHVRLTYKQISEHCDLPVFLVSKYLKVLGQINIEKLKRWSKLICKLNSYWRQGVKEGLIERLVVQW